MQTETYIKLLAPEGRSFLTLLSGGNGKIDTDLGLEVDTDGLLGRTDTTIAINLGGKVGRDVGELEAECNVVTLA